MCQLRVFCLLLIFFARSIADYRPNLVFLVVESTDGRAWSRNYQDGAVALPNIQALQDAGIEFANHYSNAPVCCPSRATFWSGRHAHNIPHNQKSSGIFVEGVWNNYEGLPPNFSLRMDQVLDSEGYNVKMSGKLDYTTGGHSENVFLNAWTMYTRFPYNINASPGGWTDETGCVDEGTVKKGSASAHQGDWDTLKETTTWIREVAAKGSKPFFVYQGMNIVHPPYVTNEKWFSKVNQSKVKVPSWKPLGDMHPCDFQSSMLKGCIPPKSSKAGSYFYEEDHRKRIRTIYLAMIAEFDAMVGEYVKSVKESGRFNNTIFIVTSDHGDMQMEHQQFYKMVPYDASSRVPMVIMDGRVPREERLLLNEMTQLIDIYPTVLSYAQIPRDRWPKLDGNPVQPLLDSAIDEPPERPDFVVSQFHGDNIAMSWFLIVRKGLKLVVWGTGDQHPHQLFNLTGDSGEQVNLVNEQGTRQIVVSMLDKLRTVVDYPSVAKNVAKYGHDSMQHWVKRTANWQDEMAKTGLRWHQSWAQKPDLAVQAVEDWLSRPSEIATCRSDLIWPPVEHSEIAV